MARSHSFWLIVDGGTPTAFRAKQREDLLPTLHQLQRKQPAVALVWFERGRTWPSQLAAHEALAQQRVAPRGRKPGWRPGGDHVDPRAKYNITRDQKRARFKERLGRDSRPQGPRGDRPPGPGGPFRPRSPGSAQEGRPTDRQPTTRPRVDRPTGFGDRPWRPKGPWKPRGPKSFGQARPRTARPKDPRGPKGGR